jgi:hypothetical protein
VQLEPLGRIVGRVTDAAVLRSPREVTRPTASDLAQHFELHPAATSGWIWWRRFDSIPAIKAEPKMDAAVLEKIGRQDY